MSAECQEPSGVIFEQKLCAAANTLRLIEGKYKPLIIHLLSCGVNRFGLLRKSIKDVSRKTMAIQLDELEREEIIWRKSYPEVPPRVEYFLTEKGRSLKALVDIIYAWGLENKV